MLLAALAASLSVRVKLAVAALYDRGRDVVTSGDSVPDDLHGVGPHLPPRVIADRPGVALGHGAELLHCAARCDIAIQPDPVAGELCLVTVTGQDRRLPPAA